MAKIGFIGTGIMGKPMALNLRKADHDLVLSRHHGEPPAELLESGAVVLANPREVAREAEFIIVMVPDTPHVEDVLFGKDGVAEGVGSGKVVIDITNPLTPDYMGLTLGHSTSAAEEIARALPQVQLVKAFNTLFAQVLADGPVFADGQRGSVFVASDSERAKQTAIALADSFGFDTVDAGGLVNARYLEPLAGLNIYLGYGAGLGTAIAPAWLHK